ncbi:MAG TPA: hypothetical protein PKA55_04435 [Rhodoblastus sp.]|nr:hypothetical protein [Rhodoblastus sp.]
MSVIDQSCPVPAFLIGQDSCGRWVVQDRRGLCGGLFINREEAIRFAMLESGLKPQAVLMVPEGLELSLGPEQSVEHPHLKRNAA